MSQPDFSDFVVHFTKDAPPYAAGMHPEDGDGIQDADTRARLSRMLDQRQIRATHMPWTNQRAVCFTECTWPSLLRHCRRYSSFGIGFRKQVLFAVGGGPAIYIRQDHFNAQLAAGGFDDSLYPFLTPFVPAYAPAEYIAAANKPIIDYTYEREWRVPQNFDFEFADVAFVIVNSHTDIAGMPANARAAIPAANWVIASNYRKIEELWPQHNVGGAV